MNGRLTPYGFPWALLLRAGALAGALLLSRWARLPWLATVALGLVGAGALACLARNRQVRAWSLGLIWLAMLCLPATLLCGRDKHFPLESYLDPYYGVLGWLMGIGLWPWKSRGEPVPGGGSAASPAGNSRDALRRRLHRVMPEVELRWKLPALTWLVCGTLVWLSASYLQNLRGPFYAGIGLTIGLLLLCLAWFRWPFWAMQAAITLMLLCIGLPAADLLLHPPPRLPGRPEMLKQYALYSAARKNPAAFEAWWSYFWNQWLALADKVLIFERQAPVPLRLRPNSQGTLVQSQIHVNSRGFRGPELPPEKRDTYRIVALGESTTFGFTINADDRPWPEMLAGLIRERLKPGRPVEVINAGLPSADLPANLLRFPSQILPLQPDLIICYHGFNGFHLLDPALPRASGKAPPVYHKRPLRLLADCEYRARLMLYRRAHLAGLSTQAPTFSNLMETDFARAYGELIQIAQTNHIRLALADFSMAANESSPPELVEFFRPRTPAPYWVIKANAAHSRLVRRLAEQHPEITLVDTHPHLDGEPDQFIDVIHFSHPGEVQMAENIFEGIKGILEQDLTPQKP